jgi:hypothetical protein
MSRWPGYAAAAHDAGVRAVFAFPLVMLADLAHRDLIQQRHLRNASCS